MDSVTLADLKAQCRQRADMENSNFVQDPELVGLINHSAKKLYDKLISAYADEYFSVESSFQTAPNQNSYDLPANFYKLLLVQRGITPTDRRNIKKFSLKDKASFSPSLTWAGDEVCWYRLKANQIQFLPQPNGIQTIYLDYIPVFAPLVADVDTLNAINGWDEYIVYDVAIKMRAKEETDSSDLFAFLQAEDKRIEEMKENRDASGPERVVDVRKNAWGMANECDEGIY